MIERVFCLVSGGLDSSTALAWAAVAHPNAELVALSFDYGQRHAREMEFARRQAVRHRAEHCTLHIKGLLSGMLVNKPNLADNERIPDVSYAELPEGISPTYVSFRNGVMLSLAAAEAQSWVMSREKAGYRANAYIYIGTHADDAARDAYPDCTMEFIGAMASAVSIGTYYKVRLRAPFIHMDKAQIVKEGWMLGVDFSKTWSCYKGGEKHCGICPTCRSRKEAFELAGVPDPTEYEVM